MDEKNVVEVSGEDMQSAIEEGLNRLGLDRDEVRIEVLDEGNVGFLGLGKREAIVRLTPLPPADRVAAIEDDIEEEDADDSIVEASTDVAIEVGDVEHDEPDESDVALQVVEKLLFKMNISASAKKRQTEPDDLTGERRWVIDVRGRDLGPLIGQRGETLNSFQHIARLMTGHAIRHRPTFIIDVEGYRQRREKALARLAERMASKAIKRGKPVSLEPMPPNERRIVHITLRDNDEVYTESHGEGRRRRVRVFPKE